MTLKDTMAADAAILMSTDDFATTVTYRPKDGAEVSLTAVVYEAVDEQDNTNGVTTIVKTRSMSFATEDLSIDLRGSVFIDGVEWSISSRSFHDDVITTVELKRHELYENSRPNLRRS